MSKLGDRQVALEYFRSGWDARRTDALPCGERLIDDARAAPDLSKLDLLLDEGIERFSPPAHAEAGRFFNYVLRKTLSFPQNVAPTSVTAPASSSPSTCELETEGK